MAKKKKEKTQNDVQADSGTSDSDDEWSAKSNKAKKKVSVKRSKRKIQKPNSEESGSGDDSEKASEPEEGACLIYNRVFLSEYFLN